jgi:hypothetical protein
MILAEPEWLAGGESAQNPLMDTDSGIDCFVRVQAPTPELEQGVHQCSTATETRRLCLTWIAQLQRYGTALGHMDRRRGNATLSRGTGHNKLVCFGHHNKTSQPSPFKYSLPTRHLRSPLLHHHPLSIDLHHQLPPSTLLIAYLPTFASRHADENLTAPTTFTTSSSAAHTGAKKFFLVSTRKNHPRQSGLRRQGTE